MNIADKIARGRRALEMRSNGRTREEVAAALGIKPSYVMECIDSAVRLEYYPSEFRDLSVRAANALIGGGMESVEQVRQCQVDGRLRYIPNLGNKSHQEIVGWLKAKEGK